MKKKLPFFYVLTGLYLVIWVILQGTGGRLQAWGVNRTVLQGAHLLVWLTTLLTYRMASGSFSNPNPQVSVRAILGGLLIKFFVFAMAAFVYIFYQKKQVNIPALSGGALLYALYTALEIRALLQELRRSDG